MSKFLTVISRKSEIISENDSIDVDQKNLIITGGNGCGKTTLLNDIYSKLSTHLLQRNHQPKSQIENNINFFLIEKKTQLKVLMNIIKQTNNYGIIRRNLQGCGVAFN
ncbi:MULTISPECIES: hypothetical protein [Enterobacter]|uniref:hypothetical protein n=1 Tax=Enterobacter TaxID=547 RepID=UPI001D01AD44|nr:hypothetical protein [Enterobacter bugandensis]MCK7132373.1 hypothetical protein [Enterobacter bugandensis]